MTTLDPTKQYDGFRIDRTEFVEELNSQAYVMTHIQSGARLLYMANNDDNKVFSISFRTPPQDSTGVAHILEHSVLCGSRKFPLKEPFVELVKGSLNTFLNAMTFPDKTMYPIASRNDKDFHNLMDVYLDAVFFPAMLTNEQIMMQEGWHYELDGMDKPLTYKGVVYNEMKGVFSSPDSLLEQKMMENLFPDTTYGYESGGDPDVIPTLTYENFKLFHKKYYHPANSYIFLYGDLAIENTLRFINEEYLRHFAIDRVDSKIAVQPPFAVGKTAAYSYGITSEEDPKEKSIHSLTYVVGDRLDQTIGLAFKILTYALLETPAAPLKKAIIDKGIGKEVSGYFQDSMIQPLWNITVTGSDEGKQSELKPLVLSVLRNIVKDGVDRNVLEGALNRIEFTLREADFSGHPKGLMYNIRCMDTWLYDGDPLAPIQYEKPLKDLRVGLDHHYFENLIETYLLNNPHHALVSIFPEKGIEEAKEKALSDKLAAYKKTLSNDELAALIRQTETLRKSQAAPETPEALATIPILEKADLERNVDTIKLQEERVKDIPLYYLPEFSNGIVYVNAYFDLRNISVDELPYVYLLEDIIGELDTEHFRYDALASSIDLYTGGFAYDVVAYPHGVDDSAYTPVFRVKGKALRHEITPLMDLFGEIVGRTLFTNTQRLKELIEETKSIWDMEVFRRGQTIVSHRLLSYVSPIEKFMEIGELSYYSFIVSLAKDLDHQMPVLIEKLAAVSKKIFTRTNLMLQLTGEEEDKKAVMEKLESLTVSLEKGIQVKCLYDFPLTKGNEGIMTNGKVQYVAKGGNFRRHGYEYTGSMMVLDTMLRYDYLWTRIRVQGGAYGAFAQFSRNGNMLFCSYRDPNLRETVQIYNDMADYLAGFSVSEREMTKYVIGTLSRVDMPMTPSMKGDKAMARQLSQVTTEQLQQERNQLIDTTLSDIRALAPIIRAVMADNYVCALGSEQKLFQEKTLFYKLIATPK